MQHLSPGQLLEQRAAFHLAAPHKQQAAEGAEGAGGADELLQGHQVLTNCSLQLSKVLRDSGGRKQWRDEGTEGGTVVRKQEGEQGRNRKGGAASKPH